LGSFSSCYNGIHPTGKTTAKWFLFGHTVPLCHGIPVEGLDFSDQKQAVPSADCLRGKQVGDITRIVGRAAEKVRSVFCCFSNFSIAKKILQKARERQEGIKKGETPNPP
jgi:hypothetical protein